MTNTTKLPLTTVPSSEVELPILKKTYRVRAMTIKEEKNLLTAKDAGNDDDIHFAISELVKECTYGELDFNALALADIVALFIKIVELSKGPVVTHTYICHNKKDDGTDCLGKISVNVDLRNVKFNGEEQSNLINLGNGIIAEMTYPTPAIYKAAFEDSGQSELDNKLHIYAYCIKSVIQGENIYNEFTNEEIYNWLLTFDESALKELNKFFENMPQAVLAYDIICPNCGHKETVTLTELNDFFM